MSAWNAFTGTISFRPERCRDNASAGSFSQQPWFGVWLLSEGIHANWPTYFSNKAQAASPILPRHWA